MTKVEEKIGWMTMGHVNTEATSGIRCKNCVFCRIGGLFEKSTCHALPPYFQGDGWDGYRRWPEVDEDEDWCGKFVPRAEPVEKATNDCKE